MFSSDQINDLAQELMNKLEMDNKLIRDNNKNKDEKIVLTPSQALVILALLAGSLQINSVVINRNQAVDIVLTGTLKKQEESEMDRIIAQMGHMPFDEVMKAMVGRFK